MTKHNSGPWRFISRNVDNAANWASRIPFAIEVEYPFAVLPIADVCDQPNAEANARLIAAAPDLLEALKAFIFPYQEECRLTDRERQELGRAAIRKAEGEKDA